MVEESARLTGRQEDARAAFRELNRRFPDSAWTHYLMGSAYENQEDHARAIQEYQAALSRDAHIPNANFAIGYMQWRDRDYEAARPWLEKELAVQPCHALASYFLGELARDGRDLTGAVRHYQQAIRCGIAGPDAHLGLGVTFSEMNQDAAALRELQRAAAIDPTSAKAHYRLALIYRKLHRTADADREYRRVHELQQSARDKISLGMGLER
jgi:tetratricopeptide (TPR) repeat protein